MRALLFGAAMVLSSGMAIADEPEIRELINCQPGASFAKLADAVGGLDAERLDTIKVNPSFAFYVLDGGPLPARIFHRAETGVETNLPFSQDGTVSNFIELFNNGEKDEFCLEDPARAGQPKGESDTYSVSLHMQMNYINSSGTYTISELRDGIEDGNSILTKLYGGEDALSVMGFTDIHVAYEDKLIAPDLQACSRWSGKCKTVPFEELEGNYVVAIEALENMKAFEFRVGGGAHKLSPTMSYEKIARAAGKIKADTE